MSLQGDDKAQGVWQEMDSSLDKQRQDRQEKLLVTLEDWHSLLQNCIIDADPTHASGWIIAARLQEVAGKLAEASHLLQTGCKICPYSENIWLQAARLQTPDNARAVTEKGLAANPHSVKLWLLLSRLEDTDQDKLSILNTALHHVPTAHTLWQAAVQVAAGDHAFELLKDALKWCPEV